MDDSPHILVVDDHREIRDALAKYLAKQGYRVTVAESAAAARRSLEVAAIDLAVIDIMMPGEDGLSLTRDLRAKGDLPVVLLTAVAEETDRIVGLELGADDYVTKPFNPRELLARIKAVLRRAQSLPPQHPVVRTEAGRTGGERLRFADWILDFDRRELLRSDGTAVPLSTGEFLLLGVFLRHPRRVLSRDQLLDLTRGRAAQPFDRAVDNQISRLRRKIEADPKQPNLIVTHWGGGYALAADVAPAEGAPS
ncbi:response regulator [Algihabitans albus]|uniref:response regulator n=1 Tax=Algihabitans albus TaxID=2164067 RepID=UPI000E5C82F7|nr:response regulator [Algihabitans albus]